MNRAYSYVVSMVALSGLEPGGSQWFRTLTLINHTQAFHDSMLKVHLCADQIVNKNSLRDIPAVSGLVLTLRVNIRSSGCVSSGLVTATHTLISPPSSSIVYDVCSNPTTTTERGLDVTL